MFWNGLVRKKVKDEQPTEFIYEWRGRPRIGRYQRKYRPYIAINAIRDNTHARVLEIAGSRGDRSRAIVERNIFGQSTPVTIDPWFTTARIIWDEILPIDASKYTHLLEVGIKYDDIKARSHFLKTPMALNHGRFDADFCAFEVARFLTDVLNDDYHDFDGAALEIQQMWIFSCIFAKWKSLRDR